MNVVFNNVKDWLKRTTRESRISLNIVKGLFLHNQSIADCEMYLAGIYTKQSFFREALIVDLEVVMMVDLQ